MFVEVANANDLPVGRARVCTVGEQRIALYHTPGGFFATGNTCPHRGGPLGEGDIIGNEIVCPWHLWSFDIASGICGGNPTLVIPTFEVMLDGDRVLVNLA
jgi:nitrite reductase (NADH) small subunit